MTAKTCATCRHWVQRVDTIGDCRKLAPTMVTRDGHWNMRVWPNTYDIDFCDAYKKAKEDKLIPADTKITTKDPHDDED